MVGRIGPQLALWFQIERETSVVADGMIIALNLSPKYLGQHLFESCRPCKPFLGLLPSRDLARRRVARHGPLH
jgi:hypothetical protein